MHKITMPENHAQKLCVLFDVGGELYLTQFDDDEKGPWPFVCSCKWSNDIREAFFFSSPLKAADVAARVYYRDVMKSARVELRDAFSGHVVKRIEEQNGNEKTET